MRMAYERLRADRSLSDRQLGYVAIAYYALLALSLLATIVAGEGAFLGYVIGIFFVGAYREHRHG